MSSLQSDATNANILDIKLWPQTALHQKGVFFVLDHITKKNEEEHKCANCERYHVASSKDCTLFYHIQNYISQGKTYNHARDLALRINHTENMQDNVQLNIIER